MPAATIGTGDGDEDEDAGADDLGNVTLVSFAGSPAAIGPFGTSTLHWHVNGVTPRVRILLNNSVVSAVGNAAVSPAVTASYTLSATVGAARRTLGHVTVMVERSTCEESPLGNLLPLLFRQVDLAIRNPRDPEVQTYWAPDPNKPNLSVTFNDKPVQRIKISMVFAVKTPEWYLPDGEVKLNLEFGLGVLNGALVAVAPTSNASVSAGWLGWLLGPYVMIALAMWSDRAKKIGFQFIEGLLTYINMVLVHPDPGKRVRSVIAEKRNGQPFFGFVQCAPGADGLKFELPELSDLARMEVRG